VSGTARTLALHLGAGTSRTGADLPRRTRWLVGASIAAGVGAALAGVALLVTAGYVVSRAADRPPILELTLLFVGVRFFGLARPVLRYAERLASHDATLRLLRHVRRWFCEACLPLAPARLLDWRSGDLLARVAADVDTLQEAFLRLLAPVAITGFLSLIVVIVLGAFDWRLVAIVATVVAVNGVVLPSVLRTRGRREGERADAHAALTADVVTLLRSLDDVAAFGQEGAQARRIAERQAVLEGFDRRDATVEACHASVSAIVTGAGVMAVAAVLASRVHEGVLDGAWAVALTLGVLGALEAIEALPQVWLARDRVAAAARRVFDVTDATPAAPEPTTPETWPTLSQGPSLRLKKVSFGYDSRPVLDAVSLDVAPGEHVALVGPSGAGKSTLLGLVCRFRDPALGCIAIDERDIRDVSLPQLRAAMAVVPQDVHVFDATLRDNVRLARVNASDDEVRRVLEAVRLAALPGTHAGDLDAMLGDEGRRLSAGERQRLGVARIMLTDARLVLVDEPAAHLDLETERDVLAALRLWARGRTLVVVSHRLSGVCRFDRIAVLDAGRLIAAPHETLLGESAVYRDLWEAELHMLA
jgi:ATP-binding cassette, subfamily C, bacterial CydC